MSILPKISGFVDYSEQENLLFTHWKHTIESVYQSFGFIGFNPRPVESIAALQFKGGIAHQIYTLGRLQDGSMTDMALPFDRTVPLAVYVAAHQHALSYPFKRFDVSHSFRGERPQAGRFRGFIQADADIIDRNLSLLSESECLMALLQGLKQLQIPPFTIYLNHIDIPKALIRNMGITENQMADALRIIDKWDKIGKDQVAKELSTLCPTISLHHLSLFSFRGAFSEFLTLCPPNIPGCDTMQELLQFLQKSHIDLSCFSFCPGMVRGLDYYTGIVLEATLQEYPDYGSIASGGRYNQLIDGIVQKKTDLEGFGISIGLTRLFDFLKRNQRLPIAPPPAHIIVTYRESALQIDAAYIAHLLRQRGVMTDLFCGQAPIGKQLSYANKKQIPIAFMLMGDSFVIKQLITGEQTPDISSCTEAIEQAMLYVSQWKEQIL